MTSQDFHKLNLPDSPGVYFFRKNGEKNGAADGSKKSILYIGRATSLRDRVKSYFGNELIHSRGPLLVDMVTEADTVTWEETGSVLEAIILENNLIKVHQPHYNTKEKDNRSYNYIVVTEEKFPRVIIVRGRNLESESSHATMKARFTFGPYPHATLLRDALKIIRKMLPFRDTCMPSSGKPCFNRQIGLCPGVCDGTITADEYALTIRRIILFLQGKTSVLLSELERDMRAYARKQLFEKANEIKKTIYALSHVQDMALIKKERGVSGFKSRISSDNSLDSKGFRIEAYDIAHLGGKDVVGVMIVIRNGMPDKMEYRKFRVRTGQNDDVNNLKEILSRRFARTDWPMPDMVVVDGGTAQKNMADEIVPKETPVVSVVKDDRHVAREILGDKALAETHRDAILLANHEAHRFAITYHKLLRKKAFLNSVVKRSEVKSGTAKMRVAKK